MPGTKSVLKKLRKVCLALPDAHETITWGEKACHQEDSHQTDWHQKDKG